MEAKSQSLIELFTTDILEVPFFQRSYVWTLENWEELLEDLLDNTANHFLGSIILKREDTRQWEPSRTVIIDGQQRLTTLSVLTKALYDACEDKKKNYFDSIVKILFYKEKASDDNYKISIKHSYHDSLQFEDVIGKVEDGKITSPILDELDNIEVDDITQKSLIKRCYKYFYEKLSKKYQEDPETVINFGNALLNTKNKIIVLIDLDPNDQEQKIFDSINTAGIRLSATDTIKNFLFQKLIEYSKDRDSVVSYYKNTWEKTFENDEEAIAYWAREKSVGRHSYQNSELLLRSVAIIKGFFKYKDGHSNSDLSELYKKYIVGKKECEIKEVIQDIIDYAKLYRERIPNFHKTDLFEFDNVERRLLKILDESDSTVFTPYILYLFKKHSNDDKTLETKFIMLEKLFIRRLLTGFYTNNYSKLIEDLIKDENGVIINRLCNEVDSSMIKNSIKTKVSNKIAGMLLFWIELYRRHKDNKHDVQQLKYNYQVEHIMPIKWEENWGKVPYVDNENKKLPNSEKSKQKRNEKITSLGNMTLLTSRLNNSISNSSFKEKIEGVDKKHRGMKDYSDFSITKKDIIENVYSKGKEWNEAEIAKRERKLADEIIEIWG